MRSLIFGFILLSINGISFGQLIAGQIGSNQSLCYGSAPKALTFTIQPSGGTLPYSYQWQRSNNGGGSWSNISGATRVVYSPPVLGRTASFRCRVSDGAASIVYTNSVIITILPNLKAGIIGNAQTICPGTVPNALLQLQAASGGSGSYSYQWQNSTNGLNWSNIPGATSSVYSPSALTADIWYRRLVIDGTCGTTSSNSVKIALFSPVNLAQLHDNKTIFNIPSTTFNVVISGGISPFTINYSRNGVAQAPVTNYISGSDISTGVLTVGIYTYALTSVTDANGCSAQSLGNEITVTVSENIHYDFTYVDRNSLLADGWDFIARTPSGGSRNTEQTSGAVVSYDQQAHPGVLRIPADNGDLWEGSNNSDNTLFRDLPSNWTSVRLKISSFAPLQDYQQAGLLAYQDDNNYVHLIRIFNGSNRITFSNEVGGRYSVLNSFSEIASSNLYFRLDRDPATETITSYYSLNGSAWTLYRKWSTAY